MTAFVQPVELGSEVATPVQTISVKLCFGEQIRLYTRDLSHLCLEVYKEWPYLYEGSEEEGVEYIEERYVKNPDSLVCLAFQGNQLIGAAMGLPLCHAPPHYLTCFKSDESLKDVFYWGELAVVPKHRHLKVAKEIYTKMGKEVIDSGKYRAIAFCEVTRSSDFIQKYPKPDQYRGNDSLWLHLNFEIKANLTCQGKWRLVGEAQESTQDMVYWWKTLN